MSEEQISLIVKDILINQFHIDSNKFNWDSTLEKLNSDFVIIGYLIDLEQELLLELKINFSLQHIEPSFHTPKDIVILVKKLMSND